MTTPVDELGPAWLCYLDSESRQRWRAELAQQAPTDDPTSLLAELKDLEEEYVLLRRRMNDVVAQLREQPTSTSVRTTLEDLFLQVLQMERLHADMCWGLPEVHGMVYERMDLVEHFYATEKSLSGKMEISP